MVNILYHPFHPAATIMDAAVKGLTAAAFLVISLLLCNPRTDAFNIDTQNARILRGEDGTHFGYTMSFEAKATSQGNINMFIGAPKAYRTLGRKRQEVGSLTTCFNVLVDIQRCDERSDDNRFPDFTQGESSHIEGGYGYGLSVSETGTRLVCAPFWKDEKWAESIGITFMPGRCTAYMQRDGNQVVEYVMPYFRSWSYFAEGNFFTGMAGFGASTDIYEDSIFAVGVPGLTVSEGGVAILDYRQEKSKMYSTTKQYKNTVGTTAYGYLGYQVIFGRFCNAPSICFAAGAPNMYTHGLVKLYKWSNEELLVNFQNIKGEQPWAYFGSVLCAVDTDNDEMDELIIGAPYYQAGGRRDYDVGKVYIYKRETISKFFYPLQELHGSTTPWSRFGSAIQDIGDINLDSYSDIAIGAPGEESGNGCIFIYLGHMGGGVTLSQYICATQIRGLTPPVKVKGFGSTLSGATYTDDSPYPIFAVGAFQSDKVIVLRSSPILDVTAHLSANPNPIDVEESKSCTLFKSDHGPCAVIVLCMKHAIRQSKIPVEKQEKQKFRMHLELDGQIKSRGDKRAAFLTDQGDLVDSLETSKEVDAKEQCFDFKTVIRTEQLERDRFTPIQVEFSYELEIDHDQRMLVPIMDPLESNKIYHMITFANDCGTDNICYVDLKAGQRLMYPTDDTGDGAYITFGHTKEVTVLVTVSNSKESCYWTDIKVKLNQPLTLIRFNSDTIRQCDSVSDPIGTAIVCNYYQPLANGDVIGLTLTFDTDNLSEKMDSLTISTEAKTKDEKYNPETLPEDNTIKQAFKVYIVTDASILGTAVPLEMKISKSKKIAPDAHATIQATSVPKPDNTITLNHKVLVKNEGPSFLPKTNLNLTVPVYIPDGTLLVIGTSVKLLAGKRVIDCSRPVGGPTNNDDMYTTTTMASRGGSDVVTMDGQNNTFIIRVKREMRDSDEVQEGDMKDEKKNEETTYIMSCDQTPEYCQTFSCELPTVIQPGGHAELNVTLTLDSDNIPLPAKFTSFRLELKTVLEEPDHKLLKPWNATNMEQVLAVTHTTFHIYQSGGEVELWVIIVGVGAGILLIVVIVLVCWKFGFFKRKRHFQVAKWKRESQISRRASQKSRKDEGPKERDNATEPI